jgi:chitin synthase
LAEEIPESAALTREIIKYLIIINFACLVLPIFFHLFTHPRRVLEMLDPRTFLSYLYYQAAYSHTFVIYAFCNVDDVTWGTKGAYDKKTSQFYTYQQ